MMTSTCTVSTTHIGRRMPRNERESDALACPRCHEIHLLWCETKQICGHCCLLEIINKKETA